MTAKYKHRIIIDGASRVVQDACCAYPDIMNALLCKIDSDSSTVQWRNCIIWDSCKGRLLKQLRSVVHMYRIDDDVGNGISSLSLAGLFPCLSKELGQSKRFL